ncbi:diguanylate cyclase [Microbacterium sp. BK668]|uniref:diguanylate cyclase domain-containing protein n=1 Tax=Microbacterium sp. BK668 TaxID=2512118 RepID=UPI00105D6CCA|nr:diguanylate cyclase [Microbacterium sp. BK668]TDN91661.1 diguanylate cyclase (GGDEF)-like protein [Microbacterium sp. BK668]
MSGANALPVGVVHVDQTGRISDVNPWFAEWASSTPDAIIGRPIEEFLVHADDDLFPSPDGPGPWVMVPPGHPGRAVMVARHSEGSDEVLVVSEASERFRALRDLRRRYALADRTRTRLELIMDSSVAFATATTEERLAQVLADATQRAYRAEESTVYLHEPDGTSVVAAGPDPLQGRIGAETLIDLVSAPRRIIKVVDPEEGERLLPGLGDAMRASGVHALIGAPLHHEESDFGAFISWFHHTRTFDAEAAPLAGALAGQAAQALATLRLQARLAHAAMHDEVTGLPNRRLLEAQMEEIVGSAGFAVLFIDLDGFKGVNDLLGHHAGDRMLHEAADRLLAGVRSEDLVARYGGDEFVIVARDVDNPAVAWEIAERVLEGLRSDPGASPAGQLLSASIGVAVAPPGAAVLPEQLMRQADVAMYRAKAAGGNRIVLADDDRAMTPFSR